VGAGVIARQHLACVSQLAGVQLAAVCDVSPGTGEAAAERFGVPAAFTRHDELLERIRPDVVHVTTPPGAHFQIAADALAAGATAIVEKPLADTAEDSAALIDRARSSAGALVEDYNYVFNSEVRELLDGRARGEFGEVRHVEVDLALDVLGRAAAHDRTAAARAGLGDHERDFLPHLASLAHAFVGVHHHLAVVRRDHELVALVDADEGTATLRFSALSQPDGFWLRVHGTRMRAEANLFEPRLTFERLRPGPRPLNPLLNQLAESRDAARAAVAGVLRKVGGGPGAYEGLWRLLSETYGALRRGAEPPVSLDQVEEVNRLAADIAAAAAPPG
jgi:predicted dehydrogenase